METDRNWVFGGNQLIFDLAGQRYHLDYWRDAKGAIRFYTDERLIQARSARDLAMTITSISSMLTTLKDADSAPMDKSHISKNDGYMQMLQKDLGRLTSAQFETVIQRLYENLRVCPDITLRDLSELLTAGRQAETIILVGETDEQRLDDALNTPPPDRAPFK